MRSCCLVFILSLKNQFFQAIPSRIPSECQKDQVGKFARVDLGPNCLQRLPADGISSR